MSALSTLYGWVWGAPLLILLMGVGVYLTIVLKGIQFRYLPYALKVAFGFDEKREGEKGDVSHFESLMTALAATLGIGNIAGVATAFVMGGPGALFWMWVCAFLGMATKYAEALLAVKYRKVDENGEMSGGPMHFIEKGLKWKPLAIAFALFGTIVSFCGGNMLQANSVADIFYTTWSVDPFWTGVFLTVFLGLALVGGIKSIGKIAGVLVPVMALFYIAGAMVVIVLCYKEIPGAIAQIMVAAFSPQAAMGGFMGSTVMMAIQVGLARGLMTSESGLGTGSIAAAAAKTDHPARQAMVSMTGSFLATVVMCSVTALVLGVTGVLGMTDACGMAVTGASLTAAAFDSAVPFGGQVVAIGLVLFAFTTLLGWAYYGEKCVEYLMGPKSIIFFRIVFCLMVLPGATLRLDVVWLISDIANGLMAIPNLIGILFLSHQVVADTKKFLVVLEEEKLLAS